MVIARISRCVRQRASLFSPYLTLLRQVGAGPASYVGVATPVLAMLYSTAVRRLPLERLPGIVGVALAVAGNVSARAARSENALLETELRVDDQLFPARRGRSRSGLPSLSGGPGMSSAPSRSSRSLTSRLREHAIHFRVELRDHVRRRSRRRDDAPVVDHVGIRHAFLLPARHVGQQVARGVRRSLRVLLTRFSAM